MADQPDQPKIIIDSDWKASAQKEREKLAAKEKEAAEKAKAQQAASGGMPGMASGPGGDPNEQGMPEPDFQALVGTLVTQCLIYMGGFPDPQTGRAMVSLEHARFHIDLLAVLEQKCKGNMTEDEAADISMALNELRLRFVEIVKAVAQASKEGRLPRQPGVPGPMPGPGMMTGGISGPGM